MNSLIGYKRGQASVILRVKILDSSVTTGAGKTGLAFDTAGLVVSTIADNEATPTTYTQAGGTVESIAVLGTYAAPTATKCRFKEVDATNHPGVYEIQLADARLAVASAKSLLISISGAANAAQCDVVVPLRDLDPYDGVRAGLTALANAAAGASGGLLISGSNDGTTTLAALTVTGAFTVSGGVAVTNSTVDGAGVSIAGNGTGAGVTVTSTGGNAVSLTADADDVVYVNQTGGGSGIGVFISTANGDGVSISATDGTCLNLQTLDNLASGSRGIYVSSPGESLHIESTGDVGASVTGGTSGVVITGSVGDGVGIASAGGSGGVYVVSDSVGVLVAAGGGTSAGVSVTGGVGASAVEVQGPLVANNAGNDVALGATTADALATALLDLAGGVQAGWTLRQAQRAILAVLAGKLSGAGTGTVVIRDPGDGKDRVTATVDASNNRTAVVYDMG